MGEWLQEFWTSKAMFARTMKGLLFFTGSAAQAGAFGALPSGMTGVFIPALMQAISIAAPAGENNMPKTGDGGVAGKVLSWFLPLFLAGMLTGALSACAPNFLNKPTKDLTPKEVILRGGINTAIELGAEISCSRGDPGLRNEIIITLAPLKQCVEVQDTNCVIEWAGNKATSKLDKELQADIYDVVKGYLDQIDICTVAPESTMCKNLWDSEYGLGLLNAIEGCYKGALKRGNTGGVGA